MKHEVYWFALFVALFIWVLIAISNYNKLTQNQPKYETITLEDGTPCVINKNGGIACNWRTK